MQTGVIIRRNAGLLVPDQYLQTALTANSKGWGAAIFADGKLEVNHGDNPSLELLKDTMESFKDNDITFYLCNSDAALNEDDISPYTICSKDDTPELIAFIDGKFPGRAKAGSSHPAEFFIASEYLIPKLQAFYELTDGNVAKIVEQLKKPIFKEELLANAVDRGFVTFLASTGDALTFAKENTTSAEFPWGWVSNHYGFQQKAEAPEVPAKKSMFGGKSTVREKAPAAASPAVAAAVVPPKTETAAVKNYKKVMWAPAKTLSRKDRKVSYKNKIGYCPKGWEDCVQVEVYSDSSNKILTFSEAKALGLQAIALPSLNNPEKVKDTEVENVPQPVQKPAANPTGKVVTERLPLISPQTRDYLKSYLSDPKVQKIIGDNASIIHDPMKVKQLEERFADLSTQMGMKDGISDFMSFSYEMMYDLCEKKPDAASVMMWTFRNMLASKMAKKPEVVETVEDAVETPPVKKGMFGNKKVA
jgi:hypothetical protein